MDEILEMLYMIESRLWAIEQALGIDCRIEAHGPSLLEMSQFEFSTLDEPSS